MNNFKRIGVIGSGMGSLSAAALLSRQGHQVTVLEQNYLPGGCTSSYFRQGYIFEAGATTVVGLDEDMPLRYLLQELGLSLDLCALDIPMRVHLADGQVLTRYRDLEAWIAEAERVFGPQGQRGFWEECYRISRFVWATSLRQRSFPPSSWRDLPDMAKGFRPHQLAYARLAFVPTTRLLQKYGLLSNPLFVDFVNEQLLITAQNQHQEVNALFGATALCYTNYGNYYIYGGLIQLVKPFIEYIEAKGGQVHLRRGVSRIERLDTGGYRLWDSKAQALEVDILLSGLPLNNTLDLWDEASRPRSAQAKLMESAQLNSAFQLGLGLQRRLAPDCLHHQIHLSKPLPGIGSRSIFLSFSHPQDWYRCPLDRLVASVSTHIPDPARFQELDKAPIEAAIIEALAQAGLLQPQDILYQHSSAAASWARWTQRAWGFVGGYPQYMRVKPWQMQDARLNGQGAYICGDSAYPGQGIPGVCLSGIIAAHKIGLDY